MNNLKILKSTEVFVKKTLENAEKGHDWWHIQRVINLAKQISEKEGGDNFIIELAALLHDISDAKFNGGDEEAGERITLEFLKKNNVDNAVVEKVVEIIANVSYKGGFAKEKPQSIEFKIVQDADRLDSTGAIGIARTFLYSGFKNREMYNPNIKPMKYKSASDYHKSDAPSINHFYEKLLLLKDLMNTKTARQIAEERHKFMLQFLEQFFKEWNV